MSKIFKVIFIILFFLAIPSRAFTAGKKNTSDPSVDDAMTPPKELIDNLNRRSHDLEKEYERAIKLFQSGKIDDALDLLLKLDKLGHGGARTTLTAVKKQKPALVNAAYNRAKAKEENEKRVKEAKEQEKNKNSKTEEGNKPKSQPKASDTLDESAKIAAQMVKNNAEEIKKDAEKKTNKKKKKDKKISKRQQRKKNKEKKEFMEKNSRHYIADKNINSFFKIRNRDTVNNLIVSFNNGQVSAGFTLGLLAQDGVMVEQDINAAYAYFVKACQKDFAKACNNAGHILRFGLNGNEDLKKAEKLLTKAALLGDANAIYNLAILYSFDETKDNIKAYLFSKIGLEIFDGKEHRKENKRLETISKQSFSQMTYFQHEYVQNYYPHALAKLLSQNYKKGKIWADPVSMPQNNGKGIIKIDKISPIIAPSKKTKKIFLTWRYPISPRYNHPIIKDAENYPAFSPNSIEAVYGMMYRYDTPYELNFSLTDRYSSITARIGDKININIYGTIFATGSDIADESNTSIREKTTGTSITQALKKSFPAPENKDFKAWMTYGYEAISAGISEITFEQTDGEKYIVKVEVK